MYSNITRFKNHKNRENISFFLNVKRNHDYKNDKIDNLHTALN